LGGRGRRISEFEASLVYRVSSRTARATQRNPVSKKQKQKQKQKQKNPQTKNQTKTKNKNKQTNKQTKKPSKLLMAGIASTASAGFIRFLISAHLLGLGLYSLV
jgi:thiol:disulfide interchange protein